MSHVPATGPALAASHIRHTFAKPVVSSRAGTAAWAVRDGIA